ncbi:hypothetical protein [Mesorhizobium sp.]|uniref:hypothetical protein n=1 Tax=Mesorhizobium sp. TaxID=1871066 RepID=UPI000FE7B482|nr:hypothetical protein [Mesorhizobium sp.]RWO49225.1 MAG: hypothetical protein EOS13_23085 [Mesorhizobium sp.]
MAVDRELISVLVSEVFSKLAAMSDSRNVRQDYADALTPDGGSDRTYPNERPKAHKGAPFVEQVDPTDRPFSDVGTKGGVDNPSKMLRGWTLEGAVGRYLTSPASLLQILAQRERAVAIISAEGRAALTWS